MTLIHQSTDQGVIENLKAYYLCRRSAQTVEAIGRDTVKTSQKLYIYQAILNTANGWAEFTQICLHAVWKTLSTIIWDVHYSYTTSHTNDSILISSFINNKCNTSNYSESIDGKHCCNRYPPQSVLLYYNYMAHHLTIILLE